MPSSEGQGPMVWSGVPAGEAAPPKAAEIRAGRQGLLPEEASLSILGPTSPQMCGWHAASLGGNI